MRIAAPARVAAGRTRHTPVVWEVLTLNVPASVPRSKPQPLIEAQAVKKATASLSRIHLRHSILPYRAEVDFACQPSSQWQHRKETSIRGGDHATCCQPLKCAKYTCKGAAPSMKGLQSKRNEQSQTSVSLFAPALSLDPTLAVRRLPDGKLTEDLGHSAIGFGQIFRFRWCSRPLWPGWPQEAATMSAAS